MTFSEVERPHNDELTLFVVTIEADGLRATSTVESLDGDEGFDADASQVDGIHERRKSARLSQFLKDLGEGGLWDGRRTWRSLGGELILQASTDRLGHISLDFEIAPRPWEPSWSARTTLTYDLGELDGLGDQLRELLHDQSS